MNPFVIPCVCAVCGEDGMALAGSDVWSDRMVHTDPNVCIENLRAKNERELRKVTDLVQKYYEANVIVAGEGAGI